MSYSELEEENARMRELIKSLMRELYEKSKELNEGVLKWHKVADGDLPKNEDFVCNQDGLPCWFDIETDQWLDCEGTQIRTTEWCEIPKYEEE